MLPRKLQSRHPELAFPKSSYSSISLQRLDIELAYRAWWQNLCWKWKCMLQPQTCVTIKSTASKCLEHALLQCMPSGVLFSKPQKWCIPSLYKHPTANTIFFANWYTANFTQRYASYGHSQNTCPESLVDECHQYIYFGEHFTAVVDGIQGAVSVPRNEHSI